VSLPIVDFVIVDLKKSAIDNQQLFHFFVRRVLAATAAEFLELQPFRGRLPVLGGRIIPLFAITALQGHNFSGHENSS
jgi:hypothetical protein